MRPVRLLAANLRQVGVREWGLPTGMFVGRLWRSEKHRVIACILEVPGGRLIETRALQVVDHPADQWMPVRWRAAMSRYQTQWPASAPRFRRLPWMSP